MSEKRMVIIDYGLMRKIDKRRGQLSRSDFVAECVKKLLSELELETGKRGTITRAKRPEAEIAPELAEYVTNEEFEQFKRHIDELHQEFTDFFIKYGKQLAGGTLPEEEAKLFSKELKRLLQL